MYIDAPRFQSDMSHRTTKHITEIKENGILVFGSNESGIHSSGFALIAKERFGAKIGVAYGMHGNSYGIPTVNAQRTGPLSGWKIRANVIHFLRYAKLHPELTFFVVEIGGFGPEVIAPMFKEAIDIPNVYLPKRFWDILRREELRHGIRQIPTEEKTETC